MSFYACWKALLVVLSIHTFLTLHTETHLVLIVVNWLLRQRPKVLRHEPFSYQLLDRNSAELNKLRSEYAGLMKELGDTNSKLQQEEHQRKSLEVNYKQNVSQLEVC